MFNENDDQALTELARQVGLALHNVKLDSALQDSLEEVQRQADELRASRSRIVQAGDEQRRSIERDLHDGAQQHLVALAVSVRLARQLAESDPAQSLPMLDQIGTDLQDAVQELRSLAHGIYPPLLAERGLPDALSAAATRAALPTSVQAENVGRYDQALEAAVYFCVLEALQNAGKHAGEGSEATITLRDHEGALVLRGGRRRRGLRHGNRRAPRARLREHGGPCRRHRRNAGRGLGTREGDAHLGPDPALRMTPVSSAALSAGRASPRSPGRRSVRGLPC